MNAATYLSSVLHGAAITVCALTVVVAFARALAIRARKKGQPKEKFAP